MSYTYIKTRENGDATSNYELAGKFPVKFIDLFKWILANEDSFHIKVCATNECYGGWTGNRLEVKKDTTTGDCFWINKDPEHWFEEIAQETVLSCHVNGGWGQVTYFCTFEEP